MNITIFYFLSIFLFAILLCVVGKIAYTILKNNFWRFKGERLWLFLCALIGCLIQIVYSIISVASHYLPYSPKPQYLLVLSYTGDDFFASALLLLLALFIYVAETTVSIQLVSRKAQLCESIGIPLLWIPKMIFDIGIMARPDLDIFVTLAVVYFSLYILGISVVTVLYGRTVIRRIKEAKSERHTRVLRSITISLMCLASLIVCVVVEQLVFKFVSSPLLTPNANALATFMFEWIFVIIVVYAAGLPELRLQYKFLGGGLLARTPVSAMSGQSSQEAAKADNNTDSEIDKDNSLTSLNVCAEPPSVSQTAYGTEQLV